MRQNAFLSLIKESILGILFISSVITLTFSNTASANQVVRFSTVAQQELQAHKRVTGTLKALSQTHIASAESGVITTVFVNEGDSVKAGQILLEIDTRKISAEKTRLEAELALSKAKHALAQAEFNLAEDDYIAYKHSANKNAISEQRLRQSKAAALSGQANVIAAHEAIKALQAQISIIDVRLGDMSIKAPFDGQITQRVAEPGQWLGAGDTSFTLTSLGKLEAWLDVPERLTHSLDIIPTQIGLNVGDEMLNSVNIKVLRNVDARARTFKVISQVQNSGLMPGMSVTAWLPEGAKSKYLTVPKDAIVQRGSNTLVYKVNTNGDKQMAEAIPVSVIFHQGNIAAISSHMLKPEDKVITEGNERLMPGPVFAVADDNKIKAL
ncbi:efflux RND transporter periplasmic adaptor subunit [Pseudoalteromonas denitrificans]|uniref:RND family efflux transporter, MFP subunit n=1 Tax=Pseudoalteromonas denitrificans DSM 6059 TaxID=1123010 RepID=A0A1I1EBP8_9GAMM|nr:efflux RND transporter periplasmic adaptor subunit [Pseudoalteromonas denitrificans]SFB82400.1 RND family efflux transporter, MFP subunit [Pseudoalteromonas denitrificans DSM 6059]